MEVRNSTVSCSGKWIFLVVALATSVHAGNAAFGAGNGSSRNELQAQIGRASLTVEDMKTLLGRKTRDPSNEAGTVKTDVAVPANPLKLTLDSKSVRKLARSLAELEMKRIQLEDKLGEEAKLEIEKLRDARRTIQTSRISSAAEKDPQLSRDLFDSFLSEANSKVKIEEALQQFDEQHMITIEFAENADAKSIEAIYVGDELAWSSNRRNAEVAKK
jgi:hypothetical protein